MRDFRSDPYNRIDRKTIRALCMEELEPIKPPDGFESLILVGFRNTLSDKGRATWDAATEQRALIWLRQTNKALQRRRTTMRRTLANNREWVEAHIKAGNPFV